LSGTLLALFLLPGLMSDVKKSDVSWTVGRQIDRRNQKGAYSNTLSQKN